MLQRKVSLKCCTYLSLVTASDKLEAVRALFIRRVMAFCVLIKVAFLCKTLGASGFFCKRASERTFPSMDSLVVVKVVELSEKLVATIYLARADDVVSLGLRVLVLVDSEAACHFFEFRVIPHVLKVFVKLIWR